MNIWRVGVSLFAAVLALATTAAVAAPAPAQDIVVGQIGPWTGSPVPTAIQVNQGLKAHFNQVNARGGINGHKIALFELNDEYAADVFVKRFAEAMQRKPVALLSPIGSAALKRMLDDHLLDNNDVVMLNAIPGAEALRSPGHPRLFHLRAGDTQQIKKMVLHAQTLGITRIAVMYENIPIGISGFAMAGEAAKGAGTIQLTGVKTGTDDKSMSEAARKIASEQAQSVLVLGSPRYMADGVRHLRKADTSQQIFALSYLPAAMLTKVVGEEGSRGVGLAQTFPNPSGINSQLQRDFQAAMKASFPDIAPASYTSFHMEGYVTARVLTEALRRSPAMSAESLAKTLKTMGEIDIGGFFVSFGKSNVGSAFVDIGVVTRGGRLAY